ncbi:MAG TPA: OsmC family protein [Candidatus Acidoferrales bacterium]|jgi:peroxiredoxin-like protein|nr:OsmC family protein [Candidatus Acidoferrales bacterium]
MEAIQSYQVRAKCTRLRSGVVASDAVPKPICFSAPPEFLGEPGVWTPEHFFVASLVTCYVSTFSGMSEASKFSFVSLEVDAEGVLEKGTEGWRFTEVKLRPMLKVAREEDRERGNRLLEKAERSCLIARSISSRITLEPAIEVAPERAVTEVLS